MESERAIRTEEVARFQVVISKVEGVHNWVAPHWRAEVFDHHFGPQPGFCSHPVAVAYLTEYPPETLGPVMDHLAIIAGGDPSDAREALLEACEERFPWFMRTERLDEIGGDEDDD